MEKGEGAESIKNNNESFAEEVTSSPKDFVDRFLKSELFLKGRHNDVKGGPELRGLEDYKKELVNRGVKEDEKEIKRVFCDMSDTKLLLLHFAKYELMLKYDEKEFSLGVNTTFKRYMKLVQKNDSTRNKIELGNLPTDLRIQRIGEADSERQLKHYRSIHALIDDGFVTSEPMARAMARVMLISAGADTFKRAQADEELRFKRLLKAAQSGGVHI